jgi:TolA-binding protein
MHFLLGLAHLEFGRPQEAVEQFERVWRRLRERDHPDFVYSYALALVKLGRLEDARRMLDAESVAQWPEVPRTRSEQLLKVIRDRGA